MDPVVTARQETLERVFNALWREDFAAGVSGFFERFDSYYEQTNPTGPDILDYQNWGLRTKLAYDSDFSGWVQNVRAVLTGYALDHHGSDTNVKNQFQPSYVAIATGAEPTPKPYKAGTDLPDTNYTRIEGATLKATLGMPGADLVAISGYQNVENYGFVDFDATAAPSAGFGAQPGLSESFSQELQLISTELDNIELVGGAYYFTGSGGFVPLNFIVTNVIPGSPLYSALIGQAPNLPLPTLPVPNLPIPPTPEEAGQLLGLVPLQDLAPLIPNLPGDATYAAVPLSSIVDTKAHAFFTQGTWRAADWLRLTLGLRYSDEERILSKNAIYQPVFISDADDADQLRHSDAGTPVVSRPARSLHDYDFSTKFVIEFPFENLTSFIDSGMFYVGRTEGFKSGTWNTVALTNEPDPVAPEQVVSWEGGFKTDLFDGYARFNASAFFYDYDNLQLTSIALTSGGAVKLENAGKAKVKGLEFEMTVEPVEDLTLQLNGALLDTRYVECRCSGFDETSGLGFRTENGFDGNDLVNAPHFSGTFDAAYDFDVPGGTLEVAGTAYHNSGHWFDSQNSFKQDPYELYSARLTYIESSTDISFTLFGQNLSDELYFINGNVNDFGRFGTYGSPRLYGARVQWQF